MAERTLSQRELNRALLARQLLLDRARLPIPRALERLGGIQDQYAPNAYIRLWSCLEGFARDDLTRALERRSVVQATLMRGTIHVVSKRDFWPFAVAIRESGREWLLRVRKLPGQERQLARTAVEMRTAMSRGPLSYGDLNELTERRWHDAGPWLELVRVPPSGTWDKRRAHLFQTAENWVGPENVDEDAAVDHLVRRYLGGFGPGTAADIAQWAGMKARDPSRPAASTSPGSRDAGARSLPADLGRSAPPPRPPDRSPTREVPSADLLDHVAAVGRDVPRRRRCRRNLEVRGRPGPLGGLRAARPRVGA